MEHGESWAIALRGMTDEQAAKFVNDFTESLPEDDPMIEEVRQTVDRLRAIAKEEGRP